MWDFLFGYATGCLVMACLFPVTRAVLARVIKRRDGGFYG